MVTMEMYFDKETFEPGKNYFSIEKVKNSLTLDIFFALLI